MNMDTEFPAKICITLKVLVQKIFGTYRTTLFI